MIYGMFVSDKNATVRKEQLSYGIKNEDQAEIDIINDHNFGVALNRSKINTISKNKQIIFNDDTQCVCCLGTVFNFASLAQQLGLQQRMKDDTQSAELVSQCYKKWGCECFAKINGNFIIVIWDKSNQELIIARDHLGIESLYYSWDGNKLTFSPSLLQLMKYPDISKKLNIRALYIYLLFNYNPGSEAFVKNVNKLGSGHYLKIKEGRLHIKPYWHLSFACDETFRIKDETTICNELFDVMKDAVALRIDRHEKSHGAFLSGGMDSSSVVGLMSELGAKPIHTFSFRCKGKTFDESRYAQIMADNYGTHHYLVEYPSEEIESIRDMVEYMDEPFGDIGIEVASYILGREAKRKTNYVLTGDGGDELFAGHPVYLADNVARSFDKVPRFLQQPIIKALQFLPDTDKKKSLSVKLKRFSYSYQFPKELYSNRWRLYYTTDELKKLLNSDLIVEMKGVDPLQEIAEIYHQADGADFFSKTLYGDYHTVAGFYFNRMKLLRAFGIEGRFPMFDYRLVEYAAKIPSELKIKGKEMKYILHKMMAGFLPDEIVFRKDKLGHSVPMKNWMRDDPRVKEFIFDHLSESSINGMGYFNSAFIHKLKSQHLKKTDNHSHRLWALVLLKLWLEKNLK